MCGSFLAVGGLKRGMTMKQTHEGDGLPLAHMLRGYRWQTLRQDLWAGLTVGMIAVPLSMALAIGTGVPPQYGLYTAVVAGFVIALCGGSRFNVSGPTAAFVVVLQPIVATFGFSGLLMASFLAGMVLVVLGLLRLGRFVYWVPEPIISGFSAGIAVVIVVAQLPDFLGVTGAASGDVVSRIGHVVAQLGHVSVVDVCLGALTLAGLLLWPRWVRRLPPHVVVMGASALLGVAFTGLGWPPRTIASVFTYWLEGVAYAGIPSMLPTLVWPWQAEDGQSWWAASGLWALAPSVLAIAFLGAVESLLCAVVADGLTNTRHRPNAELVGQGLGNMVAPFVGGFAATGALARTAANIRAGAQTPVAAMTHALFVLLSLLLLAPWLGYLPMASLAALLWLVAWHMANVSALRRLWRIAPAGDRWILVTCLALTVGFGMVVGVLAAMGLALLWLWVQLWRLSASLPSSGPMPLSESVWLDVLRGPLFFGSAQARLGAVSQRLAVRPEVKGVVLIGVNVAFIDVTGLLALAAFVDEQQAYGRRVVLVGLNAQVREGCQRAGLVSSERMGLYWAEDQAAALRLLTRLGA